MTEQPTAETPEQREAENKEMNQLLRVAAAAPKLERWAETVVEITDALPDRAHLEPFLDAVEACQWVRPDALADLAKPFDWGTVADPHDPKQIEKALRAFLERRPHLLAVEPADAGAHGTPPVDMNQLIRRAAGYR